MEFGHDVAAANELAVDVELRERRPMGKVLQSLPQFRVRKLIVGIVFGAAGGQHLCHLGRETTLRGLWVALHVEHDFVPTKLLANLVLYVHTLTSCDVVMNTCPALLARR